jgi:3-deoxy-D-manno-octulosonic-acid transferase
VSVLWTAYRVVAPCLGALAPAAELFASPQERPLWAERMGAARMPGGCDAWVHAASLGEAAAVPPFLRELHGAARSARFFLTATSLAGRTRLAGTGEASALAPIDSPQATARFFAGVRPARIFLVETELWPHWLMQARRGAQPVAVVSARLSERSVARYRGLGPEFRSLVRGLAAVLCQSESDAERWARIGADPERLRVTGNLKSDGLPRPAEDRAVERAALGLDPLRPLLVLGSLRPGEARALAQAWLRLPEAVRALWQVVAVPRHPAASAELRAEAVDAGVAVSSDGAAPGSWRWDERTGVLVAWYRAADVAFVGGSLTPFAGHNPLEPAACGAAVLMGAHHASQRDYVRALRSAGALRVVTPGEPLLAALRELLEDDAARARAASAAIIVAQEQRGAAMRTVRALQECGLWPA